MYRNRQPNCLSKAEEQFARPVKYRRLLRQLISSLKKPPWWVLSAQKTVGRVRIQRMPYTHMVVKNNGHKNNVNKSYAFQLIMTGGFSIKRMNVQAVIDSKRSSIVVCKRIPKHAVCCRCIVSHLCSANSSRTNAIAWSTINENGKHWMQLEKWIFL